MNMKKEEKIKEQLKELNRLYKEQDDIYRDAAAKVGMSDSMHWIMYAVYNSDELMTQQVLAGDYYFPKQTINSGVKKLIDMGLVELKKIEGKKNSKAVVYTLEGKKFCEKYIAPLVKAEEDAFGGLTIEEREIFLSLFHRQVDYIKSEMSKL
jgi:DNA-binding MarR family transcriptional regulator